MTNRISGYSAGGINPYRPAENRPEPARPADEADKTRPSSARSTLGPNLSDDEARMIGRSFPDSEQMKLRLYGPGRTTTSVDPGERGRRLDLRG